MAKDPHLDDAQWTALLDGQSSAAVRAHLDQCRDCGDREARYTAVLEAYQELEEEARALAGPPPRPWAPWSALALRAQPEAPRAAESRFGWWPWAAFAAATAAVIVALFVNRPPSEPLPEAIELLAQSASQTAERRPGFVSVRFRGRTVIRRAVLTSDYPADPALGEWAQAFEEAHYNWRDPLSARSFLVWRGGLTDKRDSVTVIRDEHGPARYRVRTESGHNPLRSASLTLSAGDLRAAEAEFSFAGRAPLVVAEATPPPGMPIAAPAAAANRAPAAETPAGPAEVLAVLSALHQLGADAGEPVDVALNAGRVEVSAAGLGEARRGQIAAALARLPKVVWMTGAAAAAAAPLAAAPAEAAGAGALRPQLEQRAGGVLAYEELTGRVLEASSTLLARAHTLERMERLLPAAALAGLPAGDQEIAERLRRDHVDAMADLVERLRTELRGILADAPAAPPATATRLVTAAQELDTTLNRLLAGSHDSAAGVTLWRRLPSDLDRVRRQVARQRLTGAP